MIKLEASLLPELTNYIPFWTRYVDDTVSFIKVGSVNYILSVLNSFDVNIICTYESEHEGSLTFLDVRFCRTGKKTCILIGMHLHQITGKELHLTHLNVLT